MCHMPGIFEGLRAVDTPYMDDNNRDQTATGATSTTYTTAYATACATAYATADAPADASLFPATACDAARPSTTDDPAEYRRCTGGCRQCIGPGGAGVGAAR